MSQASGQVIFTQPVQEIKFQLSDAFIILFSSISDINRIFEQLTDMNLTSSPIYFIGNITAENPIQTNLEIFPWLSRQEALLLLAKAIVYFERNIEINFTLSTPSQRSHLGISDIVSGWDGIPTIKILTREINNLRSKSTMSLTSKAFIKVSSKNEQFGNKCLGHGEKLSKNEFFAYCEKCMGPICVVCYDSFENLCLGSLFTIYHNLPGINNE